ncbi:MAG: glycosyltransferase, partial [Acidimicrobiales bacterium]
MLYTFLIVCAGDLIVGTLLLLLAGSRLRFASRIAGVLLSAAVAAVVCWGVERIWALPQHDVVAAGVFVALLGTAVSVLQPHWNPLGQLFFACYLAAAGSYLTFAGAVTFDGGLSLRGALASFALLVLETIALVLAASFTFETCDVVTRVRHSRRLPVLDRGYFPRVSLHIAAYNEPPDMLIETIRSVESIDYPNFEVVVVDNNTHDEGTWRPVEAYCNERPGVRFVHVDPWPGYKSGALNLALDKYTDPEAEIVGVVDADYLVDPAYL